MRLDLWLRAEEKRRRQETRAREGPRESSHPPGSQGLHLWGSRHKGNWIGEGKSRKDLGPQRRQVTRPAPQTPGLAPRPPLRGLREPGIRPPSVRATGVRASAPCPPVQVRARGARSPPPPRLVLGGVRAEGDLGWGAGRGFLTGRQAAAAAGGGAGLVAARIPGYKHGAEGRAEGRGQVGGREQQTPPPGPAPSRSDSAFAAAGGGRGQALPRLLAPPLSLLPSCPPSCRHTLPAGPPPWPRALAAPARGLAAPLGAVVAGILATDRVTSPPATLAAWPVGNAQALRRGSGIKAP